MHDKESETRGVKEDRGGAYLLMLGSEVEWTTVRMDKGRPGPEATDRGRKSTETARRARPAVRLE